MAPCPSFGGMAAGQGTSWSFGQFFHMATPNGFTPFPKTEGYPISKSHSRVSCVKKSQWNWAGCHGFLKPNSWISVESPSYALPQSFHIPPFNAGVPTTLAARSCVESVGFHLWILSAATARVGPGRLRIWDDGMPGWQKMTMVIFLFLVEKQTQPNNKT